METVSITDCTSISRRQEEAIGLRSAVSFQVILDRDDFFAAVVCGQAGHTKHTVWPLAVEQLKPELGKDMLLQFTLLGIEARDGPNEPDGELLVA